jgi:hypothetical protein
LIADLGGTDTGTRSRGQCDLLLEHLQAARRPSRLNAWRVQGESAVRVGIRRVYNR